MLPFSGITLQQKMANISELLGYVWWMSKMGIPRYMASAA
jgi:hypothetical protein